MVKVFLVIMKFVLCSYFFGIINDAKDKDFLLSFIGNGSEDESRRLSYFIFDIGLKDRGKAVSSS